MLDMVFLISLAIILVYLILVSQLKSFLHPITIMSSIPLVVLGVAPALAITVIGGMLSTTFLVIIVVPVIYSFFEEIKIKQL